MAHKTGAPLILTPQNPPCYTLDERLHEYDDVFKGRLSQSVLGFPVGQEVAVKFVERKNSHGEDIADQMRKIRILSVLNHPACVKLVNTAPQELSEDRRPVFVAKWAANGNLDDVVRSEMEGGRVRGWNATKKSICVFGIASALKYVHSRGVMHRDLTRANIFLNERFEPIVSGFSSSDIDGTGVENSMDITPLYMAPELISGDDDHCTNAIDVSAYDICLYCLFTTECKFSTEPSTIKSAPHLLMGIAKGDRFRRPNGVSDFLWALTNRCWTDVPENIVQVLQKLLKN
jgi:serine/threonine protein kinase